MSIAQLLDYGLKEVKLINGNGEETKGSFILYQNTPNPFDQSTTIGFDLPIGSPVIINVYDMSGRNIYTRSGEFSRGYNELEIHKGELKSSGIMYYEVVTDEFRASKKMVFMTK